MDTANTEFDLGRAARRLAAGLLALSAIPGAVALAHVLETARRGVICGVSATGGDHCWACYAAPMLALAAALAWQVAKMAPRPIRVRA